MLNAFQNCFKCALKINKNCGKSAVIFAFLLFFAESRIFVTGGRDQIIRIWDPFDPYKTIARLKGHRSEICAIFVKNEGKRLLSMSKNRTIKVWNLKNYECTQVKKVKFTTCNILIHIFCYHFFSFCHFLDFYRPA